MLAAVCAAAMLTGCGWVDARRNLDNARALYLSRGEEAAAPAAAHLRAAAESLGAVTGRAYTDDLLDAVFGRFCVGK